MPFAPDYTPTTGFATDESNNVAGRSTVKTVSLDVELANISSAINAINANLKKLQRDDGKPFDFLIEPYALSEQARALFAAGGKPRGVWLPVTVYNVGDCAANTNIAYLCVTAHTSTSVFDPSLWMAISGDGSAAASAIAAAASADAAAASGVSAAASSATATTKAAEASTSATNASGSSTSAANSASAAAANKVATDSNVTAAANSEAAAAASAGNAAASATAASNTPVAVPTHAATAKPTPVDEDELPLIDSAAAWVLKKFTWANLKAAIASQLASLTLSANLAFTGSGNRITGNFVAAADGVMFQTNVANSATRVGAIGNGTGTTTEYMAFNSSNPDNASVATLTVTSAEVRVQSTRTGTGAYLPLDFYTGGVFRGRFNDSGGFGINSNAAPTVRLSVLQPSGTNNVAEAIYQAASGQTNQWFTWLSSGSGADNEFVMRNDGQAYADGSWSGGGADYAEYFEWADGNPANEDRRGISVKLVGDLIAPAQAGDTIIGVISGNPSVVGDAAWNMWKGKYLLDDYGTYIMEEVERWSWVEVIESAPAVAAQDAVLDADGNEITPAVPAQAAEITKKEHQYWFDGVPADVTVPADKTVALETRRKLNPDYDPTEAYVPREQRQEWDTVGLMGKLRIRKGQPVAPGWIKMRDVSATVEEWLIK